MLEVLWMCIFLKHVVVYLIKHIIGAFNLISEPPKPLVQRTALLCVDLLEADGIVHRLDLCEPTLQPILALTASMPSAQCQSLR
jgi:hypothetical protein